MSLAALSCKPQNYKTTDSAFRNVAVAQLCISALFDVVVVVMTKHLTKTDLFFFRLNVVITLIINHFKL